jgi:hypothetical protein
LLFDADFLLHVPLENGVVTKEYPGLPAHVHVKNMNVDDFVRRKGIANQLKVAIEEWEVANSWSRSYDELLYSIRFLLET